MYKILLLLFAQLTIFFYSNYLSNETARLRYEVSKDTLIMNIIDEKLEYLRAVNENIPFIKNRIKFLKNCTVDDLQHFLYIMAEVKGVKIDSWEYKAPIIKIKFRSNTEIDILAFLKIIFYKAPFLTSLQHFEVFRDSNEFCATVLGELYSVQSKRYKVNKTPKSKGFGLLNNEIVPNCVISNNIEKSVLIDGTWFNKNQKYKRFLIIDIQDNFVILYDPIFEKQFNLKIGEKTVICP